MHSVCTDLSDHDLKLAWKWIHESSYWAKDIPWEVFLRGCRNSLCFGIRNNGALAGFARVVTDESTFAWLCDVIVDDAMRGQGLGKSLVSATILDPRLSRLRRWGLATADAHDLYSRYGFVAADSRRHMERVDRTIYQSNV
jgi:GNAT superfamily N-acetyltransferase